MANGTTEGHGYIIERVTELVQKGIELVANNVGGAVMAVGGLLSAVGLGGLGEAMQSVGARGRSDNPMNENHKLEIASHAPNVPAVVVAQAATVKPNIPDFPDDLKEKMAAAVAILATAPAIAAHMFQTTQSPDRGTTLGTGAEHGVAVAALSTGRGMGMNV